MAVVFAICSGGVNYTRRFYHEIVKQGANGASPIWNALHHRTAWQQHFTLRAMFATTQIYERVAPGGSPLGSSPSFLGLAEGQLAPYPATMMARARELSAAGQIYRDTGASRYGRVPGGT